MRIRSSRSDCGSSMCASVCAKLDGCCRVKLALRTLYDVRPVCKCMVVRVFSSCVLEFLLMPSPHLASNRVDVRQQGTSTQPTMSSDILSLLPWRRLAPRFAPSNIRDCVVVSMAGRVMLRWWTLTSRLGLGRIFRPNSLNSKPNFGQRFQRSSHRPFKGLGLFEEFP